MKTLVAIFLFLSVCTKAPAQFFGIESKGPPFDYNTLPPSQNYTPPTEPTTQLIADQNRWLGWQMNFGMNNFYGHFPSAWNYSDNSTKTPPPDPAYFNAQNVNVKAWADSAAAWGVQFAGITGCNEYGFLLYPSYVTQPSGAYWANYWPPANTDTGIMYKFVTEFRAKGIEPYVYFNTMINWNACPSGGMWESRVSAAYQNELRDYLCKVMQEMIVRFRIMRFWLDYGNTPSSVRQALYNVAHYYGALIVGNTGGEQDFSHYPYDINSQEEFGYLVGGNTAQNLYANYNGTTYYRGWEYIITPLMQFSEWYYVDDACPLQPDFSPYDHTTPFQKRVFMPASDFNTFLNAAKNTNKPLDLDVQIDRNGNIVSDMLNYYRQFNFNH